MSILYLIIGFVSGVVLGLSIDEDKPQKVMLKNGLIASLDDVQIKNNRVTYRLIRFLHSLKDEDNLSEKTTRIMAKCDAALDEYLKNK